MCPLQENQGFWGSFARHCAAATIAVALSGHIVSGSSWFIYFHKVRHPVEMAEPEINAFLTHLAVKERVSA